MTQEELCERAGISVDAVSRIEGGTRVPTLDTLQRLSEAFGVPPAVFFEGATPPLERIVPVQMRRVVTLLETQPNDVLTLAESVVTAVVRAYGAGTATKSASSPAPLASPKGHSGSPRGGPERSRYATRKRDRTP